MSSDKDLDRALVRHAFTGNLDKVESLLKRGAGINERHRCAGDYRAGLATLAAPGSKAASAFKAVGSVSTSNLSVFGASSNRWSTPVFVSEEKTAIKRTKKISFSSFLPSLSPLRKAKPPFDFPDSNGIDDDDVWTCTALIAACRQGHTAVVELLLRRGADANSVCSRGGTALFWAARFNRKEVVCRLLGHSHAFNFVNLSDRDGVSALHVSVQHGHRKVVESLLEHPHIDVNAETTEDRFTPLHTAVKYGYTEIAKALAQHKDIKVNAVTKHGDSALTIAARLDSVAILSNLIQHEDIDLEVRNVCKESAVHIAAKVRRPMALRLLLTLPQAGPPRRLLREMREVGCAAEEDAKYLEAEIERLTSTCERGRTAMPVNEEYKMNAKDVGNVLILNVRDFDQDKSVLDVRVGSEKDVLRLERLFTRLHFNVHIPTDEKEHPKTYFTIQELRTILRGFSRKRCHETSSMCAVVVMSHGASNGRIFASDGFAITVEEVLACFTAEECQALHGKPKFFIFQACRGSDEHEGVLPRSSCNPNLLQAFQTDSVPFLVSERSRVSSWSDFAIAFSSIPNHVSYRVGEDGVFLRELCGIFGQHAHCLHLADLLNLVSKSLDQFETDLMQKQTCCIEYRNFWKRLYFPCWDKEPENID